MYFKGVKLSFPNEITSSPFNAIQHPSKPRVQRDTIYAQDRNNDHFSTEDKLVLSPIIFKGKLLKIIKPKTKAYKQAKKVSLNIDFCKLEGDVILMYNIINGFCSTYYIHDVPCFRELRLPPKACCHQPFKQDSR